MADGGGYKPEFSVSEDGEAPTFGTVTVDGIQVPIALLLHFLAEAAAGRVDISDFTAALAPGQASGLFAWAQANEVSFEALLKAIEVELRRAVAGGMTWQPGAASLR
jgi:hypothetical protein